MANIIDTEDIPAREKEKVLVYLSDEMRVRLKRVISYQHFKKGKSMDMSPYLRDELIIPHIEAIEKKMKSMVND